MEGLPIQIALQLSTGFGFSVQRRLRLIDACRGQLLHPCRALPFFLEIPRHTSKLRPFLRHQTGLDLHLEGLPIQIALQLSAGFGCSMQRGLGNFRVVVERVLADGHLPQRGEKHGRHKGLRPHELGLHLRLELEPQLSFGLQRRLRRFGPCDCKRLSFTRSPLLFHGAEYSRIMANLR